MTTPFTASFCSLNVRGINQTRKRNVQNDDFIVLNDETKIYGFTNDFSQQLGLNLCLIIANYTASSVSGQDEPNRAM